MPFDRLNDEATLPAAGSVMRTLGQRFIGDRSGNIAVLFALALVPMIGAVGAAVDYSMANSYRTNMQKALDATGLALSRVMPLNDEALNEVALKYFLANLGEHKIDNVHLTVVPQQGTVSLRATADYAPTLAKVFGATQFELVVNSEAKWGIGKVEVALVLDNSGSMGSLGRMTHLKAAAHDLLNVLQASAKDPEDAKVAIVPFDQVVNVGPAYVNESWIDWTEWEAQNGSNQTTQVCSGKSKNCNTQTTWVPNNKNTWHGCVRDRDRTQGHHILDTTPTTSVATKYPAWQCNNTINNQLLTSILPLTNNWAALHSKVDAMTVAGYTNITIGLVWGWHLLSPEPLFTEGRPYGTEDMTKIIILMTDGDNTRNRWGNHHNTNNNMNNYTAAVCTNIKNQGIQIYTVRLIEGNANLLRNCASSPSMYYDVQQAAQLTSVFKDIASQIASLHLSK